MIFTLVTGSPCSGKSTFVQQSRGEHDVVVDLDALMIALGSPRLHGHDAPYLALAIAARLEALREIRRGRINANIWYVTCWPSPREQALLPRTLNRVVMPASREQCHQWARDSFRPAIYPALIDEWFAAHGQRRGLTLEPPRLIARSPAVRTGDQVP